MTKEVPWLEVSIFVIASKQKNRSKFECWPIRKPYFETWMIFFAWWNDEKRDSLFRHFFTNVKMDCYWRHWIFLQACRERIPKNIRCHAIGLAIVKKKDSRWFVDIYHNNSGTQEMGGQGRQLPTHILAGLLTLSQAKGADCAPHITTCPPCFG